MTLVLSVQAGNETLCPLAVSLKKIQLGNKLRITGRVFINALSLAAHYLIDARPHNLNDPIDLPAPVCLGQRLLKEFFTESLIAAISLSHLLPHVIATSAIIVERGEAKSQ